MGKLKEKLKSLEEISEIIKNLKKKGKRVVFANGCFDLLHGGHISYLEEAKKKGDVLIVAVNSDKSVKLLKGENRPIIPEIDRCEILSAMWMVDYIFLFDDKTCDNLLMKLKPDVHAKGTDYTKETVPERETVLSYGGEIFIAGDPKENATKDIIKLILERYEEK